MCDPHKWLFQPYEAGCVLVRDAGTLERAFAIQHDVLQDSVWGAKHANLADQGIQLSRGFRALDEDALASLNRQVLARIFWDGQAFVSSTMVNKRFVLRLCIVNHITTWNGLEKRQAACQWYCLSQPLLTAA